MKHSIVKKEAIVAEYLVGDTSYRELGLKHGIGYKTIHFWVMKYQGKQKLSVPKKVKEDEPLLPTDIKQLQAELRKAQLHNKLLNAMIDIAEDQLKIDIRKKSGTKR